MGPGKFASQIKPQQGNTATKFSIWPPGNVAVLCLALGSGLKAADSAYELKPRAERETKSETKSTEGQPAKFNKASGIIGMDVRNHNDERLGEIKDVVFDLKSERVAYAVLGTGGVLAPGPNFWSCR